MLYLMPSWLIIKFILIQYLSAIILMPFHDGIGFSLAPKYIDFDFIFFPENMLNKLLKSKFSEFLVHSLILYSISKSEI
jgi:hypothetical protein